MSPLPYCIEEAKRGSDVARAAEPMIFKSFLKSYRAGIRPAIFTHRRREDQVDVKKDAARLKSRLSDVDLDQPIQSVSDLDRLHRQVCRAVPRKARLDSVFFASLHTQLEQHMKRRRCRLLLASLPGQGQTWAGWALGGEDCLIYVWVKEFYRRQGISLALVRGLLKAKSIWYPYHGPGAESYLPALEEHLGVRFRYSPQAKVA